MAAAPFDLASALAEATALIGAIDGVRSAATDPAKVHVPGVWVQCTGFAPARLDGGYDVDLRLVLIARGKDTTRAIGDLSDLFGALAAHVALTGAVTPAVAAPHGTDLPALSVPARIRWTPTQETP